MLTDIKELDDHYAIEVDLPGFHKDEIDITLDNGYLTIKAHKGLKEDEKDKNSIFSINIFLHFRLCPKSSKIWGEESGFW